MSCRIVPDKYGSGYMVYVHDNGAFLAHSCRHFRWLWRARRYRRKMEGL